MLSTKVGVRTPLTAREGIGHQLAIPILALLLCLDVAAARYGLPAQMIASPVTLRIAHDTSAPIEDRAPLIPGSVILDAECSYHVTYFVNWLLCHDVIPPVA